jgi:hypothetical protein
MTYRFFGLDGEMSSSDLDKGGRLIQIGVTAHTNLDGTVAIGDEAFCALLNPGPNFWAPIAEAVHGFTEAEVAAALPASVVDDHLVEWLLAHGADLKRRGNTVPIGLNVGAFDMPHVAAALPRTSAMFARRTVDLNAILFTLDGASYDGAKLGVDEWKTLALKFADRTIAGLRVGSEGQAHDAGYDALQALHAWRFLRSVVHRDALPMPVNEVPAAKSQTDALEVLAALGVERAVEMTGVPRDFLIQWSRGGRAVRTDYLAAIAGAVDFIR